MKKSLKRLTECTDSISDELAKFKSKMLEMPQMQMYNESLCIYCWEQTAYYMTEYMFDADDEMLLDTLDDNQFRNLIKLCKKGIFIKTVVTCLMNQDDIRYCSMDSVGDFILETLTGNITERI